MRRLLIPPPYLAWIRRGFETKPTWSSRTGNCGDLREADIGKRVRLTGWVQYIRAGRFLILRDGHGSVQLTRGQVWPLVVGDAGAATVTPDDPWEAMCSRCGPESAVEVSGVVSPRPPGQENLSMATGRVEVVVDKVEFSNPAPKPLPFHAGRDHNEAKEPLRLKHRYLDLRSPALQFALRARSKIVMKMRQFLCDHEFVDIETPTLFRRTPGGAREFVVPTRFPGRFYSLVQSPQQFKQMLMVGGFERYFQIARCYRDEGARPDRQPEFTQVDIEMSYTTREGVINLIESLIRHSWPDHLKEQGVPPPESPFLKLPYSECMQRFGSDKPDLRFRNEIVDVGDALRGQGDRRRKGLPADDSSDFVAKAVIFQSDGEKLLSNSDMKRLASSLTTKLSGNNLTISPIRYEASEVDGGMQVHCPILKQFEDKEAAAARLQRELGLDGSSKDALGFLVISRSGAETEALTAAGKLRVELAKRLLTFSPLEFKFLWVQDFPLFLPKEVDPDPVGKGSVSKVLEAGIESAHHPFTQPHPEDADKLFIDPLGVRSLHYDLVLNGNEVGGGSIRIHDPNLQRSVLQDLLKEGLADSELGHLLEALGCGCPPHGGIALGLDRFIAMLLGTSSIRDVIAFPKGGDGQDLMSGAPSAINDEQKLYYHIQTLGSSN